MSVYLDYAASAPMYPEVLAAMTPFLQASGAGNPSAVHQAGRRARAALEDARDQIADALGVTPLEVIFTSGATESNNLAIHGALQEWERTRSAHPDLPTTPLHGVYATTDHPSVVEPLRYLRQQGRITTSALQSAPMSSPDCGVIAAATLQQTFLDSEAAQHRPGLTLLMATAVSSELGVIQPLQDWYTQAIQPYMEKGGDMWIHLDATQAIGRIPLDTIRRPRMPYTSLALSAHKVGGPQGVGILVLDRAKTIVSPILGGGQERGIRSGTIPVALAVGAGVAIAKAVRDQPSVSERLQGYKDQCLQTSTAGGWTPTIAPANQVPSTLHLYARQVDADTALMALDMAGICASAGTACQSGAVKRSALIDSIGLPEDAATIRLSTGWQSHSGDLGEATKVLARIPTRPEGQAP